MDNTQKPDFSAGVPVSDVPDQGMLLGSVGDEDVLLVHRGGDLFAVGASCSHYHGPLAHGVLVGDTVRCPLHHACFSLRTGEALRPAASAVANGFKKGVSGVKKGGDAVGKAVTGK